MATMELPATKKHFVFDTLPTAHVMIGKNTSVGSEGPDSRFHLNVETTVEYTDYHGLTKGEQVYVCLSLTLPQMAGVVKDFFEPATVNYGHENPRKNFFMELLDRLLRKRWAVATSPVYKSSTFMSDDERKAMDAAHFACPRE